MSRRQYLALWRSGSKKPSFGGFHGHGGTPIAGWFTKENPIQADDLGVPLWLRKPIIYNFPIKTLIWGDTVLDKLLLSWSEDTENFQVFLRLLGYGWVPSSHLQSAVHPNRCRRKQRWRPRVIACRVKTTPRTLVKTSKNRWDLWMFVP